MNKANKSSSKTVSKAKQTSIKQQHVQVEEIIEIDDYNDDFDDYNNDDFEDFEQEKSPVSIEKSPTISPIVNISQVLLY